MWFTQRSAICFIPVARPPHSRTTVTKTAIVQRPYMDDGMAAQWGRSVGGPVLLDLDNLPGISDGASLRRLGPDPPFPSRNRPDVTGHLLSCTYLSRLLYERDHHGMTERRRIRSLAARMGTS